MEIIISIIIEDNLSEVQSEALKQYWIELIDVICKEFSIGVDQLINSAEGEELFRSIGYDNPDVLLLRWLRARKFDVHAAVQQLLDTLKWRQQWGVNTLLSKGEDDLLEEEILTGKTYFMGQDKEGRPVNYIHVQDHIKDQYPIESTEKLGIFSVETGRKLLKDSIEVGSVVVDMNGFGMQNMDYQLVRFFIQLLENYYPESLGVILIIHAPFLFYSCWAVIRHWLDPVVESKIHFLKHDDDLTKFIDRHYLPKRLNGTHPDFEYIPPTQHDRDMIAAFRADKQGKKLARAAHRRIVRQYLELTLKWANSNEKNSTLIDERQEATKQLRQSFESYVPYIHTRTHYHRAGLIHEPIFEIAYEKLRLKHELNIVEF